METRSFAARHPAATFFALTYAISWGLWLPIVLGYDGPLREALFVAGIFGPALAGAAVTRLTGGSVRAWLGRTVRFRVGARWYAAALLIPAALVAVVSAVYAALGNPVDLGLLPGRAGAYAVALVSTAFLGGGQEEVGWRGFALPHLERAHGPVVGTLVLGVLWGLWHLPIVAADPEFQHGLDLAAFLPVVGLSLASVVGYAFLLSWLFNRSASVVPAILLHAGFNTANELLVPIPLEAAEGANYTALSVVMTVTLAAVVVGLVTATRGRLGYRPEADAPGNGAPRPPVKAPRRAAPALAGAAVLALAASASAQPLPDTLDFVIADVAVVDVEAGETRFREALDALRGRYAFPGATAAYALADGAVGTAATGWSDAEARTPMTAESRMLAASTGKTFVAAVALALAQEGALDLDAPVPTWLGERPWFARLSNADALTLRHLLRHTAGLPDHVHSEAFARAYRERWDGPPFAPEDLVAFVLDEAPLFAPGEGWAYSDTGYLLVGLAIEEATGERYYDLLAERFLVPLGLGRTAPSDRRALAGLAAGYLAVGNAFGMPQKTTVRPHVLAWDPAVEWTGGGLVTTASDLAVWGRALFGGRALPGPYLPEMLDAVPVRPGLRYGLGVTVREGGGALGPSYGHAGWIPGYVTDLRHYPRHGLTVAFQVNTDVGMMDGTPPPTDEIARRLGEAALADLDLLPPAPPRR